MRYIGLLVLFIVGVYGAFAQSTGKISYTISNGLQIAGVDGTNPVIYDNDYLIETPEDAFLWLKAHNGEVNLVGNISTRDMYGCESGNCLFTHDFTFRDWTDAYAAVTQMGLKNIPAPVKGANEALTKPASGRIEDTRYYVSEGSELILREARKASPAKPLLVLIGGNPTSVANAYLKDPSIADRIIVFHVDGWRGHGQYNMTDSWGTYVVMKKLMYIMWDGDLNSWYDGKNVGVTNEMIASLPSNPLNNSNKYYWDVVHSRWHDFADGPVVLYLFDHSLWKNVQRRTENNQPTTSNDYDYLIISENDWQNYGPVYFNYMSNPANFLISTTNVAPLVSLTSPSNNASYTQGSSVTITANATDANGTITKVEFYNGSTKLGEDLTGPYSYTWNAPAAGNYSITAKATDNGGASTTSGAVSISVIAANTDPTVNITSPGNNATYTAGATVTITATAADAGGSISKVEFFNGTTKLGEALTAPYSFSWANIPVGTFSITARATDNQGATATSSVLTIFVAPVNTPPAVTITSPANNSSFTTGAAPVINANATDVNGTIAKVEFFNGTTIIGEDLTSPYSFTWTNIAVGTFSITARATDNQGATATSSVLTIFVTTVNTPPVVSITSPANNTSFTAGAAPVINANATDVNGTIAKVEFFNGTTIIGEDLTSPYSFTWTNIPVGTFSITARATDNQAATATSSVLTIFVAPVNTPPTVSITSPANNSSFTAGASPVISANASDTNGTITRVEFFNGTTKIGEDVTGPYSFTWTNIPVGTFSITARATDNQGATTTSAVVTVSVATVNTAPAVNITGPANNASYITGASPVINVNATDTDGTIAKVEFFNVTTKLGEDVSAPYSFTWANIPAGTFSLTARATDNQGAATTSAVITISASSVNTPPAVSITSPANNTSFTAGASPDINVNATDTDGTIAKVEFFNVTTKLGEDVSAPYSFTWANIPAGTFSLTARATDNQGAATTSAVITISASSVNTPPAVSITSPANNTSFTAGASPVINVNATDTDGTIAKVEFFNVTTKLGEDVSAPYSFTWANIPAGTFSLTARATDNQGAATTSAVITISASSVNTPPAVSITSPANNTSLTSGSTVTLTATASDADGAVAKVEFFNGSTSLGEDLTSPYSFTWTNVPTGNHVIYARATDDQGAVTNSAAISIIAAVAVVPPVVNITSPTNNASYAAGVSIDIEATAGDANGSVVRVEFFSGTLKLGEDVTSPFSTAWTNVTAGAHTLTAKATDNQNLTTTSASVTITIAALPSAPLVSLTSPSNNASFEPGTSITLSATATQTIGSITKVEFFNGSTKLGEDLTAPYSIAWASAPAGTHSLSAKATDTNNLTATSAVTLITVIAPNVPPVVNIVTPGNKATFDANASVDITANATDPNGTVAKVEFFNGSVKLGEDLTSPYNFSWASVSPGIYVLVAKAIDNHGMSAAHQIQVTVNPANKPPLASAGDDITTHLPAESILIQGIGSDPEEGNLTFSWTQVSGPENATLTLGIAGELQVSNLSEGTYIFELAVTDNGDMTTKDLMTLLVLSPNTLLGQVPRFFTPNNDGMNDFWEWPSIELYEDALLTIFNRVGQKVYETTSYQNNWNGNVDGRPLQSDAYYYIIKLGNTALKGAVRIIR